MSSRNHQPFPRPHERCSPTLKSTKNTPQPELKNIASRLVLCSRENTAHKAIDDHRNPALKMVSPHFLLRQKHLTSHHPLHTHLTRQRITSFIQLQVHHLYFLVRLSQILLESTKIPQSLVQKLSQLSPTLTSCPHFCENFPAINNHLLDDFSRKFVLKIPAKFILLRKASDERLLELTSQLGVHRRSTSKISSSTSC